MKRYKIYYTTLEGDFTSVWLEAFSEDDARERLKREYWDVQRIDLIEPL